MSLQMPVSQSLRGRRGCVSFYQAIRKRCEGGGAHGARSREQKRIEWSCG